MKGGRGRLAQRSRTRRTALEHQGEGLGVDRLQLATDAMSCWPNASRAPQRLIEAMQSSDVTGWPCAIQAVAQW